MAEFESRSGSVITSSMRGPRGPGRPPAPPSRWGWLWGSNRPGAAYRKLLVAVLVIIFGYGIYFWEVRRVVVPQNHVLVVMRKNGSRSLPGDQVIIPRPPDEGSPEYASWERDYGDCNGVFEQVYPEGTYFGFSPFDYERTVIDISNTAIVPSGKVGVVVKKFGRTALDPGQVLADAKRDQRGPLPGVLRPGRYNQYANPYAYDVQQVDPLQIEPGHRGVVTVMAGRPAASPNQYLVETDEQGVQRTTEPEGFRYINPSSGG